VIEFGGLFWVLVTPFDDGGRVDVPALRRLVAFAVESGARGLTALGVNGEAADLDKGERELVARSVIEAAVGAVPVVVGVSAGDAAVAASRAAQAADLGASAVMVALPPVADAAAEHVQGVADAAPALDVVVQDYPASGHPPIDADALAALVQDVARVRALKAEDPPTPAKIAAIRALAPDLAQLTGLGGLYLLWELRAGADGAMTGFAFPELLVQLCRCAQEGDWEQAERLYRIALPALVWESQPNVGVALRKILLAERGLLPCAATRRPQRVPPAAARDAHTVAHGLLAAEATR
jgi:4-hydroxy-tetrahydrodipicolinate synthase